MLPGLVIPAGLLGGNSSIVPVTSLTLSGPLEILDNAASGETIGLLVGVGGTAITYSEVTDASNKFTVASNGLVTLSATVTAGSLSLTARATNAEGATRDETFTVTVTANTAAYANALGTGDRTATISMTGSNIPRGGGNYLDHVDGSTADSLWQGSWPSGDYYIYDFGSGVYKNIIECTWKQSNSDTVSGIFIQASNDLVNWQKLGELSIGGGASTTFALATNPYGYRYYKIKGATGTRFTGFMREIEFKIMGGPQSPLPIHVANEWDDQDVISTFIISNGGLTATRAAGGVTKSLRAALGKSSGKWAFRVTPTAASLDCQVGLCNSDSTLWGSYVGGDAGSVGYNATDGGIYKNASLVATYATYASTNTIDVCVDIPNQRAWWRKNGGNWNNDGSADPATNTGGLDISSITGALYPAFGMLNNGGTGLADFACAGFTPPSGFSAWNS